MAAPGSCVKLTQLPQDVTERQLNLALKNYMRKHCNGMVSNSKIELDTSNEIPFALVWLENDDVVNQILHTAQNEVSFKIKAQDVSIEKHEGIPNINIPKKPSARKAVPLSGPSGASGPDIDCTVTASIRDVWKSRVHNVLELEDIVEFEVKEESLFIDCFNAKIYISVKDNEEAKQFCAINTVAAEDSNFVKFDMATASDLNFFHDKMWIHGPSVKDLSKKVVESHIKKLTGKPIDILKIFQKEEDAAMMVFSETGYEELSELFWRLRDDFLGEKILTGPVHKSKSVRVINPSEEEPILRKYLSNNRRSGGGVIESIVEYKGDAIVTFKTEEACSGVLSQKHRLGDAVLKIESYYACPSSSPLTTTYSKEDFVDIEIKDILLFSKTTLLEEFEENHQGLKVELDPAEKKVKIFGNSAAKLKKAASDLLTLTLEIKQNKLALSNERAAVLKTEFVQAPVLEALEKKGVKVFLNFEKNPPSVVYKGSIESDLVEQIITEHITEKAKPIYDGRARKLLSSRHGNDFMVHLNKSDASTVRYDAAENRVVLVGLHSEIKSLEDKIDKFLKENVTDVKKISFDPGKLKFVMKYKRSILDRVNVMAVTKEITFKDVSDGFTIDGRKDDLAPFERELNILRQSVHTQDFLLKFFAIREFLKIDEGMSKLKDIEDSQQCCLVPQFNTAPDGKMKNEETIGEPQTIARVQLQDIVVHFMQGDMLGLKVKALVNPLDQNLDLEKTGLGRAILKQDSDMKSSLRRESKGQDLVETESRKLRNCKNIYHVKLQSFSVESGQAIRSAMAECLKAAAQSEPVSVAFPPFGAGKSFSYPDLTVRKQMVDALKDFVNDAGSSGDIYICDVNDDFLSKILLDCRKAFQGAHFEDISDPQKYVKPTVAPKPAPRQQKTHYKEQKQHKGGHRKQKNNNFGRIKIKIHEGEITKWKTDAIIIACDKRLDLRKGAVAKVVLKYGGDEIQDELNDNYPDGINVGDYAVSSGGSLKCDNIFFVCVPHFKHQMDASQLTDILEGVFDAANSKSISKLGLPALGTGNLGFPSDVMAQAFRDAISNFAQANPNSTLSLIDVVVFPGDPSRFEIMKNLKSQLTDEDVSDDGAPDNDDNGKDSDSDDSSSSKGAKGFFNKVGHKVGNLFGFGSSSGSKDELTLAQGDITKMKCDAIVCTIKDSLDMKKSGAVSSSLLKKCGSQLQDELGGKDISDTGIVDTSAPGLSCKKIYFVSLDTFNRNWVKGTEEILKHAEADGIKSIALPLFGAAKKSIKELTAIKESIEKGVKAFHSSGSNQIKEIKLVIFDQGLYDALSKTATDHHDKHSSSRDSPYKHSGAHKKTGHSRISKDITIKIYAQDANHAKSVEKKIIDTFKRSIREHEVKLEKSLTQRQVHELEDMALKEKTMLNFESKSVKMTSFFTESFLTLMSHINSMQSHAQKQDLLSFAGSSFCWQFKDSKDSWNNFDSDLAGELELSYKTKEKGCKLTDKRGRVYKVDFTSKPMEESLLDHKGGVKETFEIRRVEGQLPKKWDSLHSKENLTLVDVKKGSKEYKDVETAFHNGGVSAAVKSIQRVENKSLYQQYAAKKKEMETRNGPKFKNEQKLFHGSDPETLRKITSYGFSRNYSGRNATVYGEGVYFAVQSSYSQSYAQPDANGNRLMVLARVLVGKSTRSSSGMKFLPNQPGIDPPVPYDSGTDGSNVMFIIFHDAQAYPEYIIKF